MSLSMSEQVFVVIWSFGFKPLFTIMASVFNQLFTVLLLGGVDSPGL
jgi:hypothetical protein